MPWFRWFQEFPGAVIGVIGGATLTETVFAFPGMGKMLIDSVKHLITLWSLVLSSSLCISYLLTSFGRYLDDHY